MRSIRFALVSLAVLVGVGLPAAAHNWHQEFTSWSGSGASSVSPYSSSTGGTTGSFTVLYGSPGSSQLYHDSTNKRAVFDVSGSADAIRFRFGTFLASSVRPSTGAAIGWRMEKTRDNVQRGPFQLVLHGGGTTANSWTTYIVVTGSQIIPKTNSGGQLSGVDALSLTLSGMNNYSLAGRSHTDNYCYWKLWVNGTLRVFTGTNGGSGKTDPWGASYSFRSAKDGDYDELISMIGLGELGNSPFINDWGWRFDWIRWTDAGDGYFGDPYFHTNPVNQTKEVGQTATFSAATWSGGTVSYQWQVKPSGGSWSDISGATSASYTTPALVAGDNAKQYRCRALRSGYPYTYSEAATLTVTVPCEPPVVTSHPSNRTQCVGETVTLSVTASGTTPLSYQWQKLPSGGSWGDISGATSSNYTTPALLAGDNNSQYRCKVSNACGNVTSNTATLTVKTGPSIVLHPENKTVLEGTSVTFTVEAAGSPPLSYQWRKNEEEISGASSASYTIDPVRFEDSGSYDCFVSNACGTVTSDAAVLTVAPPLYPLGMSNRQLACGDWNCDPETGAGQLGVKDGAGLNTIGLLVRTWGRVTYATADHFRIDDGSGLDDGTGHPGLKVQVPSGVNVPSLGSDVIVTGISSCYKIGDDYHPRIRVRKEQDIAVVQPQ